MAVTITYGHGHLDDCNHDDPTTYYLEVRYNMDSADATPSTLHGDILQVKAIFDDGATDEYVYYRRDISNISSDEYPAFLVRYKTSEAANGAQAKVELVFTSGSQILLDSTYSTTWATASGSITAGKTIDYILFYADDDGTDGTFYVYYDFLLLHKGTFTFPHIGPGQIRPDFNRKKAFLEIPGRDGDIEHDLGMKSPEIVLSGALLEGEDWGTPDFEKLYYIVRDSDPWQWFTCDRPYIRCKASVQGFTPLNTISDNTATLGWELRLKQYSLSDLGASAWDNKQWFGYES